MMATDVGTGSLVLAGLLLAAAASAQLPPPLAEPIPAAPYTEIAVPAFSGTVAGTPELARVTDPAEGHLLEVVEETGELLLRGELGAARAGTYLLTVPRDGDAPFEATATIQRPPELLVAGPPADDETLPLFSGVRKTNAEWLLLPEEIGRGGTLQGMDLFVEPGTSPPEGTLVVRIKETALAVFPDDELDADGWTELYRGAVPEATPEGVFTVPFSTLQPISGDQSLAISLILETESPQFAEAVRHVEAGGSRFRAGIAGDSAFPTEDWTGSVPPIRYLMATMPRTRLRFPSLAVQADFAVPEPVAATGEPVHFQNLSSANAMDFAWDLTGDGTVDSIEEEPAFPYPEAGSYSVELIASNGYAQGVAFQAGAVEVFPATRLCEDWLVFQ